MSADDEKFRIEFIEKRDGPEAAKKFAQQTLAIYTEAAVQRSAFKDSVEYLREYLKAGEK